MKKLSTLLCLCTCFFFANAQCPLNNGGFENGLSGWNVTGDVQISNDSRTGSSAAEICSAQTGINQVFATQPGKVFDVQFWYNTASDHSLTVYQIRSLDANWTPLEIPGSNGIIYATSGGLVTPTNGTYTSSIEFTINTPPNAAWFQVSIWNEQGGCISIDDFEVCEVGTPPPGGCTNDTEAPSITGCPNTQTYNATSAAGRVVTWTPPVITDNCDAPTISSTHNTGTLFPIGTTSVTISASDDSNNLSSCTFNITINPVNPPSGNGNLVLETSDVNINQWGTGQVEFRVRNIGNSAIFDTEVEFNFGPNIRLVGGNEYESYQNTPLRNSWTNNPTWEAGTFANGGVKFIRFNVYSITNDPMYIYGQISSARGDDPNSTPGNGTPPTPNEDDEAVANINGGASGTPDLQMGSFVFPVTVSQGQSLPLNFNFRNVGDGAVNSPFDLSVYLSTDGRISNNDNIIGNLRITDLPFEAGENFVSSVQVTVPTNVAPGDYYFIVKVDANDVIAESNENNNINGTTSTREVISISSSRPDLTIHNLELNERTVKTGEVLDYTFELANLGTANAPQDFIVRAYLSTDGDISSDDIQDGIVPTGNFDAGLIVQDIPGASTINLPDGYYYLLLKVDADDQVQESDETNNELQASIPFLVDNSIGGGVSICDKSIATDANFPNCIEPVPGTNNIRFVYNDDNGSVETILNSNLDVIGSTPLPNQDFSLSANIDNYTLTKTDANGNTIYTRNVPQAFFDRYGFAPQAIEFQGGFVFMGWVGVPADPKIIATRTDNNFNTIVEKDVSAPAQLGRSYARSLTAAGNNILFMTGFNVTFGTTATLRLWDANLNELDDLSVIGGVWMGGASIRANSCNKWIVTDNAGLGYCKSGGCYANGTREVDIVNNQLEVLNSRRFTHRTTLGVGDETYNWSVQTSDGGQIVAGRNQPLIAYNIPIPKDAQVNFIKNDANGNQLWNRDYLITDWQSVQRLYEENGEVYIVKKIDNELFISELSCYDLPTDLADLQITDVNAPSSGQPGSTFFFDYKLSNNGTIASGASKVGLYFSRDDRLGFDTQIGNTFPDFASVAPGSSLNGGTSAILPNWSPGNYYLLIIADADGEVVESNENNNVTAIPFEIADVVSDDVDLEISTNLGNPSPAQWSVFTTTVAVTNTGGETATGIEVEFRPTTSAVYQGGNEGTASQGTFKSWQDIWEVGTLSPGEIATLDVNLFRIGGERFVMYTQVTAQNEPDNDSAPNNGICCAFFEDDEKAITVSPSALSISNRSNVTQNLDNQPFAIVNAMPNPFSERFKVQVFANESQESELIIVNAMGQAIFRKEVFLNEGLNTIEVDLQHEATGMMIVKMTPFHPYLRQIRVMRVRD